MGLVRCNECGGVIMGELEYTGDQYCKCNEKKIISPEIPEGWLDWNTLSLDEMVEHLRRKYSILSSGDAKCIHHLIEFYDEHK